MLQAQCRLSCCLPADWWLEAVAAFTALTEAACRTGACPFTWAPLSALHCWRAVVSTDAVWYQLDPPLMVMSFACLSLLHCHVHVRLLESDAAAAQRSEATAVAAARCCLRAARAIDGWQGELAAAKGLVLTTIMGACTRYLDGLSLSPAFSCAAARRQDSPRVPGRRAVAAVIEVAHLAAEALRAVAGMPCLRAVHLAGICQGGASLPVVLCSRLASIASAFLQQKLPVRQVLLTSCIGGEQAKAMLHALMALLCAQVRWRAALLIITRCGRAWLRAGLR